MDHFLHKDVKICSTGRPIKLSKYLFSLPRAAKGKLCCKMFLSSQVGTHFTLSPPPVLATWQRTGRCWSLYPVCLCAGCAPLVTSDSLAATVTMGPRRVTGLLIDLREASVRKCRLGSDLCFCVLCPVPSAIHSTQLLQCVLVCVIFIRHRKEKGTRLEYWLEYD